MPSYLHTPLCHASSIQALVTGRAAETKHLDFKATEWTDHYNKKGDCIRWTAQEEFASDIAAFMNHEGGDIVLGIHEKDGTASGFYPADKCSFVGRSEKFRSWLNQSLDPRDATNHVEFREFRVDSEHPVMVISVAGRDS